MNNLLINLAVGADSANYEQMASVLKTVSIVLFVLASVCFVIGIITFIVFKIPSVIGDLSGRSARKSIEQMREANEKGSEKSHRPRSRSADRGTVAKQMEKSKKLSENTAPKQSEKANKNVSDGSGATDVLEDVNATVNLNYDAGATELLSEETEVLSGISIQSALNETAVKFKMLQNIVLIHTDEVI